MADPLGGFLVEYWYIFLPIAIIYTIWFRNATKKRFNEEQILLENMGFDRSKKILHMLRLPSRSMWDFVINSNPITSKKYPHMLIYLRIKSEGEFALETRVFKLKSKTNKKFPKFYLRKESIFDKLTSDIDYRNNPEFSKKFFLKSLGKEKNKLAVEKLFKNFSLQKKLISNPLNIESNGDEMFYYWDGVKFPVEEIPQRISEIEFLHDNYFDVIV
tara:strand:+ start:125 stop:772 length:648 start_codon:yes stop_codon:yes gene_type:complete